MFCQKCGHQLEEMALFCTKCGEKTTVTHEQANPEISFESTIGTNDLSASPKKKSKKPILIFMVVFFLAAAVAIGLIY